jgi:hypothetical protein
VIAGLDERGFAVVPGFFDAATCDALAARFDDDEGAFRKTIVMERHGYGHGVYRYFAYPLPAIVAAARERVYGAVVDTANAWAERLGRSERYPATLAGMLARCRAAGQLRPTPLLLRYVAGDWNALHQDTYGAIAFPLQATVLLSDPDGDFTGGEFTLVESKPRKQSIPHVVPLARGDAVIFPNVQKPNEAGGRSVFRHGVSAVRSGTRLTLGLILHDAE